MEITKDMIKEVLKVVSASNEDVEAALVKYDGQVDRVISFFAAKGLVKDTDGMTEDSKKALDDMGEDSLEMIKEHRF